MRISFLGAAGTVTGSRFLVETKGKRVLVDCGMFQGLKALRLKNREPFPFDPSSLDAVLLTHAHLDHSGALPMLVRDGYRGKITTTTPSAELCRILLKDAGRLAEEDTAYANKKGFSKHTPALPLYTEADAARAIERLSGVDFDVDLQVGGLRARFTPAGHILGAGSIRLDDGTTSILFSGDLGRSHDVLMRPPETPPEADFLVVESTYGGKVHHDLDPMQSLADVVTRTAKRGGVVMIPAFAVGRAQAILHMLRVLQDDGRIPAIPVYLNSPMATDVSGLYCTHHRLHRLDDVACEALCALPRIVKTTQESKELNGMRGPLVVVAGSGMITGGRIIHHLKAWGGDSRNTVLLAGFQAAGTRGAQLADGARTLRIHGMDVAIRAEVARIDGLSGHADEDELVAWVRALPEKPRRTFIVHGEPVASDALRARLQRELSLACTVAEQGMTVDLDGAAR